jgi:hypothetical protein
MLFVAHYWCLHCSLLWTDCELLMLKQCACMHKWIKHVVTLFSPKRSLLASIILCILSLVCLFKQANEWWLWNFSTTICFSSLVAFLYTRFYDESLCKPISNIFVSLFFLGVQPLSSRWFQLYANEAFCCLLFMCMFHILIKKRSKFRSLQGYELLWVLQFNKTRECVKGKNIHVNFAIFSICKFICCITSIMLIFIGYWLVFQLLLAIMYFLG